MFDAYVPESTSTDDDADEFDALIAQMQDEAERLSELHRAVGGDAPAATPAEGAAGPAGSEEAVEGSDADCDDTEAEADELDVPLRWRTAAEIEQTVAEAPRTAISQPARAHRGYIAVGPYDAMLPTFPSPLGQTRPWEPTKLDLFARVDGDEVTLALEPTDYDAGWHVSRGIGEGRHTFGMVSRVNGSWSGEITKYIVDADAAMSVGAAVPRLRWVPKEPADMAGEFRLVAKVTPDDAIRVALLEKEHVEDFTRAWELSVALVASHAGRIRAPDTITAVGALVDALLASGARYAIPPQPEKLTSWGPHLTRVYRGLCDQSKVKRDHTGHHSPAGYVLVVVAMPDTSGPDTAQAGEIHVRYAVPRTVHRSDVFIRPERLDARFTAASFLAYWQQGQGVAGFDRGNAVKLRSLEIGDDAFDLGLTLVYSASTEGSAWDGEHGADARRQLHYVGGEVVDFEKGKVWVRISLMEPGDANNNANPQPTRSGLGHSLQADHGYMLVRPAVLRIVTPEPWDIP